MTRRVAEDLGFARQGISKLEVTVVSPPLNEEVARLYRKDRPPVPTLGHLGIRSREETATIASILWQRSPVGADVLARASEFTETAQPAVTRRETIYRVVPVQIISPRAAGAETYPHAAQPRARLWLENWLQTRRARHEAVHAVFLTILLFVGISLVGAPMQVAAGDVYRRLHRRSLAGWDARELRALAYGATGGRHTPRPVASRHYKTHPGRHAAAKVTSGADQPPPQTALLIGSARQPADRSGLRFDAAYVWPDLAAARSHLAQPTAAATPMQCADSMPQTPAHERLRSKLQLIRKELNRSQPANADAANRARHRGAA